MSTHHTGTGINRMGQTYRSADRRKREREREKSGAESEQDCLYLSIPTTLPTLSRSEAPSGINPPKTTETKIPYPPPVQITLTPPRQSLPPTSAAQRPRTKRPSPDAGPGARRPWPPPPHPLARRRRPRPPSQRPYPCTRSPDTPSRRPWASSAPISCPGDVGQRWWWCCRCWGAMGPHSR